VEELGQKKGDAIFGTVPGKRKEILPKGNVKRITVCWCFLLTSYNWTGENVGNRENCDGNERWERKLGFPWGKEPVGLEE